MKKASEFLMNAVLTVLISFLIVLLGISFVLTCRVDISHGPETVRMIHAAPFLEIPAALLLGGVLLFLCRKKSRKFTVAAAATGIAYFLFSLWIVVKLGTKQLYDFEAVTEAARTFAQGNYKMLHAQYLNAWPHQLGVIFWMEVFARLFPFLNLELSMQVLNVFLTAGIVLLALRAERLLYPEEERSGGFLITLLSVPLLLNCVFVYGTLPMLFLILTAVCCFIRITREDLSGKKYTLYVAVCVVSTALARMVKPNALIFIVALFIAVAVFCIRKKSVLGMLIPVLALILSTVLCKGVVWQYEYRSGVKLKGTVSTAALLTMDMQYGPAAGWYNKYIEQFFPLEVTKEEEKAKVTADLKAQIAEMAADPGKALRFYAEKMLTQWLDPTYGTVRYGQVTEHADAVLAEAVYSEDSALGQALLFVMKCCQMLFFAFAILGLWEMLCGGLSAGKFILPLTALGGAAYHMIFEAKSQYILVYVILLAPAAVHGMSWLKNKISTPFFENGKK